MIYTAVEFLWVQSRSAVGWAWTCSLPLEFTISAWRSPPPIYFWFIPLCLRADQGNLSVTLIPMGIPQNQDATQCIFRWRIANYGRKGLPLKVNIWTPEGVTGP